MSVISAFCRVVAFGVCCLFWAGEAAAVELKIFVNEPQGGRCSKNLGYVSEVMKEVSNVQVDALRLSTLQTGSHHVHE